MNNGVGQINKERSTSTTRLSEAVYGGIVRLLAMGDIAFSGRLPSGMDLTDDFRVSRSVERDALAQQRDDGVVISRHGSGSFVERQPDSAVLSLKRIGSLADIQHCLEFRADFESITASFAASKWTAQDIIAPDAIESCVQDGETCANEIWIFHEQIAAATHDEYFVSVQKPLAAQVTIGTNISRHLSNMSAPDRCRAAQDAHVEVLHAIREPVSEGREQRCSTTSTTRDSECWKASD